MLTPGPVVVGYDGSTSSQAAIAHGAWEAHRRGVPLHLLHAYRVQAPYGLLGLVPDPSFTDQELTHLRALLTQQEQTIHTTFPDLTVEISLSAGSAAGALVDASREASLVVVGCRGLGGFTGLLLGSVGTALAAHSHAPVMVIRPPEATGYLGSGPPHAPVVVGVDGVPESEGALGFAFEQAAARDVTLIALYAWWMGPAPTLVPHERRQYNLVEAEEEARRQLAEATAGWRTQYPDVKVELRAARAINPTVALLGESVEAGLLVVSRHGGNALTRLILGSIGDIVVRRALCPVAVVPERSA